MFPLKSEYYCTRGMWWEYHLRKWISLHIKLLCSFLYCFNSNKGWKFRWFWKNYLFLIKSLGIKIFQLQLTSRRFWRIIWVWFWMISGLQKGRACFVLLKLQPSDFSHFASHCNLKSELKLYRMIKFRWDLRTMYFF